MVTKKITEKTQRVTEVVLSVPKSDRRGSLVALRWTEPIDSWR